MIKLNRIAILGAIFVSLLAGNTALAAGLNVANEPIYLGGAADSNIVFTLDDSGSMGWNYIPDYIARNYNECKQNRQCQEGDPPFYASSSNGVYYDPSVTYTPAVTSTNVSMGDIGSPWTAVANDAFGVSGGTTNLVSGYPDVAFCGGGVTVYSGVPALSQGCGAAPCWSKSGQVVTMKLLVAHGLNVGDVIDVTAAGTCSSRLRVTGATVLSTPDAFTFTYDEGSGSSATGVQSCAVTKQNCMRNGVDTDNPFQYRTAVIDDPYTHGVPSNPYTTASNISGNPFFFVPVIQEYCTDKTLTSCIASTTPTVANPEPAIVRFCDTWAHADDVPGTNVGCQARFDGAHNAPRYSKYFRQDIVPAVTTYGNVAVGGVTVIDRSQRTDCAAAPTCTYTEEMTNFANWFTYYRTRINTMKTGVGRAFAQLNGNIRIGFAKINQGSTSIEGVTSNGAMLLGVRDFSGADKTNWFNQFYGSSTGSTTPLRRAMDYVGQYYLRTDSRGPWGTDPATGQVTVNGTVVNENPVDHSACRQSYNVFSTDGYWNGSVPSTVSGTNVDGSAGNPYQDAWSETLADVAMYYWQTDLRTDLADVVPTSPVDSANWQHVVDYTIGFGVTGQLDPAVDLPGLKAGTTAWPQPVKNTETTIDDLWHASINGRGQHFSVKSGTDIVQALVNTLADIRDRESSAAAVTLNSTSLQTGTTVYRGEMNTGDWSGDLFAYSISDGSPTGPCPGVAAGQLCPTPLWNASTVLTGSLSPAGSIYWDTGRKIATYDPTAKSAMAFRWANLNASQQTVMRTNPDSGANETIAIGQRRVDYLRGKNDSLFRPRLNYLGDIIYSSPVYVGSTMSGGKPLALYPDNWPGTAPEDAVPYSTWASNAARSGRTPMVYVGANDGMLHAFRASDGVEQFAFIPGAVYGTVDVPAGKYGRLNQLTSTGYANKHIYFVDGTPKVEDVFFDRSDHNWHTVLVGGLRAGGRGIYAMDVTDPTVASEAAVAGKVLWEFTEADDPDLGLTFSEPYIARMQDGKWAAVIGNGYNNSTADGAQSTTGHAVLFVLYLDADLSDGTWDLGVDYRKYDTMVGSTTTPNGLAPATVADVDGDMLADYIYVGDLQGNMWKVDVSSPTPASWGFALGGGSPTPLFTAIGTDTYAQPITTAPEVGNHPTVSNSYMIYFGTGKDIEAIDNRSTGKQTQTFYGIWDKNGQAGGFSVFNRSHLLQQAIVSEGISGGISYRQTTTNPIAWYDQAGTPAAGSGTYLGWYIDLINTQGGNTNNFGERQSTNSLLRGGRIIFTTQLPSTDPCQFGGSGWLMALDAQSGSMLAGNPFKGGGPTSAGARMFNHLPSAPVYVEGQGTDYIYVSDSSGATEVIEIEPPTVQNGRRSWRQLQ